MTSGHKNIDYGQDIEDGGRWVPLRCPRCGRKTWGRLGKVLCAFHHKPALCKEDSP